MRKLLLFLSLILFSSYSDFSFAEKKLLIQIPLTGGLAAAGQAIKAGIDLAINEDNPQDIAVLYDDNQYNPQQAISSLQNIHAREKIDGLIIFGAPTSMAVRSYVEEKKISTLALSAATQLDMQNNKYIKRIWEGADSLADVICTKVKNLSSTKIALISTENDATLKIEESLLKKLSIKPFIIEHVDLKETDFRTIATKIRNKKADLVISNVLAGQHSLLLGRLKEQSVNLPFIAQSSIFFDSKFRQPYPSIFKGSFISTVDDSMADSLYMKLPENERISNAVFMTALGYDAAKWLFARHKAGFNFSTPLEIADYQGVLGKYRSISSSSVEPPMKLLEIN